MKIMKKTGACKQCGNCCRDFVLEVGVPGTTEYEFTDYVRWLECHRDVKVTIKSFKDRSLEIAIGNPCTHLIDNGDGTFSCDIQDSKPSICTRYPEEDYGDDISQKCGFRFNKIGGSK